MVAGKITPGLNPLILDITGYQVVPQFNGRFVALFLVTGSNFGTLGVVQDR